MILLIFIHLILNIYGANDEQHITINFADNITTIRTRKECSKYMSPSIIKVILSDKTSLSVDEISYEEFDLCEKLLMRHYTSLNCIENFDIMPFCKSLTILAPELKYITVMWNYYVLELMKNDINYLTKLITKSQTDTSVYSMIFRLEVLVTFLELLNVPYYLKNHDTVLIIHANIPQNALFNDILDKNDIFYENILSLKIIFYEIFFNKFERIFENTVTARLLNEIFTDVVSDIEVACSEMPLVNPDNFIKMLALIKNIKTLRTGIWFNEKRFIRQIELNHELANNIKLCEFGTFISKWIPKSLWNQFKNLKEIVFTANYMFPIFESIQITETSLSKTVRKIQFIKFNITKEIFVWLNKHKNLKNILFHECVFCNIDEGFFRKYLRLFKKIILYSESEKLEFNSNKIFLQYLLTNAKNLKTLNFINFIDSSLKSQFFHSEKVQETLGDLVLSDITMNKTLLSGIHNMKNLKSLKIIGAIKYDCETTICGDNLENLLINFVLTSELDGKNRAFEFSEIEKLENLQKLIVDNGFILKTNIPSHEQILKNLLYLQLIFKDNTAIDYDIYNQIHSIKYLVIEITAEGSSYPIKNILGISSFHNSVESLVINISPLTIDINDDITTFNDVIKFHKLRYLKIISSNKSKYYNFMGNFSSDTVSNIIKYGIFDFAYNPEFLFAHFVFLTSLLELEITLFDNDKSISYFICSIADGNFKQLRYLRIRYDDHINSGYELLAGMSYLSALKFFVLEYIGGSEETTPTWLALHNKEFLERMTIVFQCHGMTKYISSYF